MVSSLSDPEQNARIYHEAQKRHLFINVVDQPGYCNVIWPALVGRPPVTVAISTNGSSPALAAHLKRRIAKLLPKEIGPFAVWLSKWRRQCAPQLSNLKTRGRFWRRLLDQGLMETFCSGRKVAAEARIKEALKAEKAKDSS